ncbi:zinc knuckle domain-containing protein [Hirsutella rhossiliensis]|uniref:Zinc knuckle domain-containing protein n=1 Tax=Hirsutella rhossiliensis TaxID=111463 RepID=A0A9P8N943_9HYPO|nr:zinc knuckle domain-containing protein [Hirsutella rhossiliensis]KAH0968009.1 zinc knuckle domain-containing protein [Hirsutella rhossiliensis]
MISEEALPSDQPRPPGALDCFAGPNGPAFRPTGKAAWPVLPLPRGKNPEYSDAAKSRIKASATFSGKKDEFHSFILSIKNKFDEDVRTFRTENSRMVYDQALESAYGNPNELSEALDRLQRLQFTVNGKTDIVDFLAEFDYLTATGRVPEDQMKHTLWQHIPANLDNSLLTKTRDESVTYEVFCGFIKDAVHCQKRSMRQTQDSRSSDRSRRAPTKTAPTTAKTPNKTGSTLSPRVMLAETLTDDEKRVHWDNGTCFICGKTGHLSRDCPDRTHAVSRVASVPVPANDSDQDSGNE